MRGRLVDMSVGLNRKQRIVVELDGDFRGQYDELNSHDVDVTIKRHRERRSLDANAYFHVLVNQIAAVTSESDDDVKRRLVLDYGTIDTDENGVNVALKVLPGVDVTRYFRYAKRVGTREDDGVIFECWLIYKPTHLMDTKEMARLIDGALTEAKELGINIQYKGEWKC